MRSTIIQEISLVILTKAQNNSQYYKFNQKNFWIVYLFVNLSVESLSRQKISIQSKIHQQLYTDLQVSDVPSTQKRKKIKKQNLRNCKLFFS